MLTGSAFLSSSSGEPAILFRMLLFFKWCLVVWVHGWRLLFARSACARIWNTVTVRNSYQLTNLTVRSGVLPEIRVSNIASASEVAQPQTRAVKVIMSCGSGSYSRLFRCSVLEFAWRTQGNSGYLVSPGGEGANCSRYGVVKRVGVAIIYPRWVIKPFTSIRYEGDVVCVVWREALLSNSACWQTEQ